MKRPPKISEMIDRMIAGEEIRDVSQTRMEDLSSRLAALTPRRYLRTHRQSNGRWRVAIVGAKS